MKNRDGRMVAMLAVATMGLAAPATLGRQDKPAPYTKGTVLVVEYAGLNAMMSDPKDRAMAEALAMLPARVRELPREIPNMPPEAPRYVNLAIFTLSGPGRISVTYNGENPSGGFFGYGANLSFLVGEQKLADELHAAISPLAAQSGMRIKAGKGTRFDGMSDIQTPIGVASFGPRQGKDGWRYDIAIGTVEDPELALAELPKPPSGMTPMIRLKFDPRGFGALRDMAQGMAQQNPEAIERIKRFESLGLGGQGFGVVTFVAGTTKDESVSLRVVTRPRGTDPLPAPLGSADFALIPSDARDVAMAHGVLRGLPALVDAITEMGGEQAAQFLEQFRAHTGVDLKADLLETLGGDAMLYASETTGGGGLGSVVAMVSIADRGRLLSALNKLAAVANSAADRIPIGPGYVRIASWKDGETDLMTLRFPGLPVPLELTMGLTSKWLICSPTPQGALAAARQASGKGDGGLMQNAVFKSAFPADKKVTSLSFSDTAHHLNEGYGILSMLGSAVSNLARSPTDPTREPGMTVPVFNELRKGVRPRISYSYMRGDDSITETHADKSVLVASCSAIAMLKSVAPVVAIPAALAIQNRNEIGMAGAAGPALARVWLRSMPPDALGPAHLILALLPVEAEGDPLYFLREMKGLK